MKTCVLVIGKMENHYIREFVEWYKKIGFTNIILFDNNDPDGERFEDAIGDYIESGYVILRDFRGKYPGDAQPYAYEFGYNEFKNDFDWFAVFDVDEFLMLNERFNSIEDYLGMDCFSNADVIRVSWRSMSDSGLVRVENGDYSLVKRFTMPCKTQLRWTKAIIRGGINDFVMPKDGDGQAHLVRIKCLRRTVDANGNPISNDSIRGGADWSNVALNHYSTKTIEEFVLNKIAKGYCSHGLKVEEILNKEYFFSGNERTEEKEQLYDELIKNRL